MEWQSVTDREFPKDASVIEVQLVNGCIQLACYADHAWRAPPTSGTTTGQMQAEIKNVVKWRTYSQVRQAPKKQKATPRTAWRRQTSEATLPTE